MMEVRIMFSHRTTLFVLVSVLGLSAGTVQADYVFGEPTDLTTYVFTAPSVSANGLSFYADAPDGSGGWEIWANTRETIHDDWLAETAIKPYPPNSSYSDGNPDISADDLTLFFNSNRPGGHGGVDMWLTTRATTDDPWSEPVNLGPTINGPYLEAHPSISPDGLSLFFCSDRPGGYGDRDIYLSTRVTVNDSWSEPVNLGPIVNSPSLDDAPDISSDGLKLFFASDRPGGYGGEDIYVTRRATTDEPWGVPKNLGPVINTSGSPYNDTPCISADGSILYWWSTVGRLRQAPIIPIVDFNGDGKVNGRDVVIMVECWGQNEPACDIGPTPLGNGIVDEKDLFVLADYLEKEWVDPTLAVHWALDETEGMLAADSAGENNGMVMGGAAWQPAGGKVGGALEFDGLNDFVVADAPAGLGDGAFSVCAWVKGGAPGQAILSAQGGAKWLYANQIDGSLMTDLSKSVRIATPLFSEAVVTDGQWHRVGLVWDGTDRILYVDEQEVARDAQPELDISAAGFLIGCGGVMAPGTFWKGLIDDVRIYNRAVGP
jgi:hypothetical protein